MNRTYEIDPNGEDITISVLISFQGTLSADKRGFADATFRNSTSLIGYNKLSVTNDAAETDTPDDPGGSAVFNQPIIIASTEVSRRLQGSNYISIITSSSPPDENADGRITKRSIGRSGLIKGGKLDIYCLARLEGFTEKERDEAYENFAIVCILNGGPEGNKTFVLEEGEKDRSSSKRLIDGNFQILLL